MKKNTKKILKISSACFGILVVAIAVLIFQNIGFCGSYSKAYFEWLPYSETDVLTFTDGTKDITFAVKSARKSHINSYRKNCKCGTCEDNFTVDLVSAEGEISIHAINYNIDGEAETGIHIFLFGQTFQDNNLFPENGPQIINDTIYIEEGKGLTRFNYKGKVWQLKQHIKKGTEPEVESI